MAFSINATGPATAREQKDLTVTGEAPNFHGLSEGLEALCAVVNARGTLQFRAGMAVEATASPPQLNR
ncbi:MAG: hypothetical protein HY525_04575 [Betaproteobacteria bacterium]|nr:hypothetical protein [Betaproteobacteria bacterium]